jgi:hypothetical protein
MSPQLTIQQLEHAIANIEKRIEAKKLEAASYATLANYGRAALSRYLEDDATLTEKHKRIVAEAVEHLLTAKLNTALVDLEELGLNLIAYRQMRSGVVGASLVIDPFKPNQRH